VTLKEFVVACRERGVQQVVLRRTAEVQPITDEDGTRVAPVQRVVLVGYGDGTLLKHERQGTGVDCMPALSEAGLTVKLTQDHKFRIER
jgi:hypothetical protein